MYIEVSKVLYINDIYVYVFSNDRLVGLEICILVRVVIILILI